MSHEATGHRNVYRRGDVYYYRFKTEAGRWRECRHGTDLQDAVLAQIRAQKESDAIRSGLTTRTKINASRHQSREFQPTLDEFISHLESEGNTMGHVDQTRSKCETIARALNWKWLDDMHPGQVGKFLDSVLSIGKSRRTRNDYSAKIGAFARWCSKRGYLRPNPLEGINTLSEAADSRRPVRALTPGEFKRLLSNSPANRRLAYWLAGGIGIRWSEIKKVQWSDIDFKQSTITLPASTSKNRKQAVLPLPLSIAKVLLKIPSKNGLVCPHPPILRTFKNDIAAAKIDYRTKAGAADRRCLRKTFITHLAMSGADLRITQRLARHSKPQLTANVYTDPALLNMEEAVERLDELRNAKNKKKTG